MRTMYDVAVIGAGPAGAVFAAELAAADPAPVPATPPVRVKMWLCAWI